MSLIRRQYGVLLAERPKIKGISLPGIPTVRPG